MSTGPNMKPPVREPDRRVVVLTFLACLAAVVAVVVRLGPREASSPAPDGVTSDTHEQKPGEEPVVPKPQPPPELQRAAAKQERPSYTNVSPMLAAFVNRNAPQRVTADFAARIERIQDPEDLAAVSAMLKDTTDSDTVRNEAAKLLSRSGYADLIPDLLAVLRNPAEGPRFRSFCIQHLWQNYASADEKRRAELDAVFRERLSDPNTEVRREALLALVRLGNPEGKKTAEQWLIALDAGDVRDLAIHCMDMLNLREHAPEIRKHLHDKNNEVRIAAVVVLSSWGDEESRGAFEDAARSNHQRVQRAGKAALVRLDQPSATNAPSTSDQSPHP